MPSLGVHEHWNNSSEMEYSRDLGSGEGIELLKYFNLFTSISDNSDVVPKDFVLYNNYPNPFNPSTTIRFDLPESGHARLEIFDLNGRLVKVLVNENLHAGMHSYKWNSQGVASGAYVYRLTTNTQSESKKMVLLK